MRAVCRRFRQNGFHRVLLVATNGPELEASVEREDFERPFFRNRFPRLGGATLYFLRRLGGKAAPVDRDARKLVLEPRTRRGRRFRRTRRGVQSAPRIGARLLHDFPAVGQQPLPTVRAPYFGALAQREKGRYLISGTPADDYDAGAAGLNDRFQHGRDFRVRHRELRLYVERRERAVVIEHEQPGGRFRHALQEPAEVQSRSQGLHKRLRIIAAMFSNVRTIAVSPWGLS